MALLVFGPKRLPELGNSLGKGIHEFKDSVTGESKDDETQEDAAETVGIPKAAGHTIEPPTTHRIEADESETVRDKTS